jgi:methylmalonyl-CoA mutase N-terminal domain/subunit
MSEAEFPGVFPFTRGIQATMYRGRLWTMRQYAGFGTAAQSNARYRYLLAQGVSGLSVAFDLPTQMGYDSDHPMAAGEVGRVGVAIDSVDDMATLFERIPLGDVSTSMTINATAIILLSLYVAVARRQGVPLSRLAGTIQNDILKEYIARGTYIYPPRQSLRVVTDIFAWCEKELPNWNTISISGYHIREAGSTAVQEVAFTLANGIAYVEAAVAAGLDVNRFGQRLSFFFAAHNDFIEEVAKFRAARRLWAHIMRERFGAMNARAQQLRFHTQTGGSTLTAQQPDNNIAWRCALSRSSRRRRVWPIRWIPSGDRGPSKSAPTRSKPTRARLSLELTRREARSQPSRPDRFNARCRMRRTPRNCAWIGAKRSSSG